MDTQAYPVQKEKQDMVKMDCPDFPDLKVTLDCPARPVLKASLDLWDLLHLWNNSEPANQVYQGFPACQESKEILDSQVFKEKLDCQASQACPELTAFPDQSARKDSQVNQACRVFPDSKAKVEFLANQAMKDRKVNLDSQFLDKMEFLE